MKRFTAVFLLIAIVFSLAACSSAPELAVYEQPLDFHTELQQAYLDDEYAFVMDYAGGIEELSRPQGITLSWEHKGRKTEYYLVNISESADMSDSKEYKATENTVNIQNLKIATQYYWTVTAVQNNGEELLSEVGSFTTADCTPRNIYCDGITNMRDLGGYVTEDGYKVKQGLLYRSGRWNVNEVDTPEAMITEAGIETLKELGIKTEIDLRRVDNNEVGALTDTGIVPEITYIQRPMIPDYPFKGINIEETQKFFSDLADESNYPMVFHCSIGTDRTGYLAYLIGGLLGVPQEDLYRDYLYSNFGEIGDFRTLFNVKYYYMDPIDKYPGETLSEKDEAYLLEIGVPQSDIDAIRNIMLEK